MQDQLKEYMFNTVQIVLLFTLLIIPQVVGQRIIVQFGLTEVKHYLDIFLMMAGIVVVYYVLLMAMHHRLINRIHDMVYVKYLIVIAVCFWVMADGYLAYIFQQVYNENDARIVRRDIVWRDVAFEDLPADVIYPNFRAAYLFVLSAARAIVVAIIAYSLMTDKKEPTLRRKRTRVKRSDGGQRSVDDLKANVHPSVLKKYQKKKDD